MNKEPKDQGNVKRRQQGNQYLCCFTSLQDVFFHYNGNNLLNSQELGTTSIGMVTLKIILKSDSLGLSLCKYINQLCNASFIVLFDMQIPRTIPKN